MQPCASNLTGSVGTFVQCFQSLLATSLLVKLWRQHAGGPWATVDRCEGFRQRPEPAARRRRRGRIRDHRAGGTAPAGHASGTPLSVLSGLASGGDRRQSDQCEQPPAVPPPPE